jgi:tetratricopeptide (TPR) repeat protein
VEIAEHGSRRGFRVFIGHCYESQGDLPYMPWVEMIQNAERETPPDLFREALGDDAPEVARIVPELRRLFPDIPPPLELPPDQQRRYIFNGIRNLVARVAAAQPRLYILEDLHWADASTLLLLEHIAEQVTSMPALIVGTYRDPPIDVSPQLAETLSAMVSRREAHLLSLRRHSEEEVEALLRALSGQAPPETVRAAVYGETEGNAFFVEELFRHLAESGRLLDEEGRFRDHVGIGELDVPANVRLVTGQRLQRLSETTQQTLAIAAVAGRRVGFELLEAAAEVQGDELIDALDEAERARLIITKVDGVREEYWFAHELIRQTLLAALPAARRRRHHLRVADALERVFADDLPAQAAAIAQHLVEAGSSADRSRLFRHLVLAGKRALESAAFEEALRYYERAAAIDGVGEPAERAELLFDVGMARRCAGQLESATLAWRQSVDAYEMIGDADAVARVCAAASLSLIWLGRFAEAVEMGKRGLAAASDRVTADRARGLAWTALPAAFAGDYRTSMDMIDQGLAAATELGDNTLLGQLLLAKAGAHHAFMELRETVEAGWRGIELLRGTGDLWNITNLSGQLAHGLTYLGRFDEFVALDQEFGPLAERVGNYGAMLQHRRMSSLIGFFRSGDLDRLQALGLADREFCERAGLPWVSSAWSWLGLVRFLRGDWDEAKALFEEAVRLEPPGSLRGWNAPAFECLAYRGDKSQALALLDTWELPGPGDPKQWGAAAMLITAVEGLTVLGERRRAAELYPSVVDVFKRTGVICPCYDDGRLYERAAGIAAMADDQRDLAEEHFRNALQKAHELPHLPEQAHTRRWYGQLLLERNELGDRERGEKVLREAIEDYHRMGMPRHRELSAALLSIP